MGGVLFFEGRDISVEELFLGILFVETVSYVFLLPFQFVVPEL